jgi:hypothetical protein
VRLLGVLVPRLAVFNMMVGFLVLALAAAAGAFVATDITDGYLRDKALLETWQLLLSKSAHGHTNLFALTHVAFGLTLPYSKFGTRTKTWQTAGLLLGTLAMGPVMVARAYYGPTDGVDPIAILLGVMLSAALAAIASHAAGLGAKLMQRT